MLSLCGQTVRRLPGGLFRLGKGKRITTLHPPLTLAFLRRVGYIVKERIGVACEDGAAAQYRRSGS